MKPVLAVLFFLLQLGLSHAQALPLEVKACRDLPLPGQNFVSQCDLLVESPQAFQEPVFVKAWIPGKLKSDTGVIVFLHGRGYTRQLGEPGSMIEDMGLNAYLATSTYAQNPHVILAPQDNFVQSDTHDRGQDYWIGADGRSWGDFLALELPNAINAYYKLTPQPWTSIGISMGAHGAMMLAMDYPQSYKAFASISPVFRATIPEMPVGDLDVFTVQDQKGNRQIVNNLGALILKKAQDGTPLKLPPHFIKIHKYDFFFNPEAYPSLPMIWGKLLTSEGIEGSITQVSGEAGVGPGQGHGGGYWQQVLPEALNWLLAR